MFNFILAHLKKEDGMGTIEIIIIIAILIGLAFLFKSFIDTFFIGLTNEIENSDQLRQIFD